MILYLIGMVAAYFATQFAGYIVHRLLHNPKLRRLHRSHHVHHRKLYPPKYFLSYRYYGPGWKDNPLVYYAIPAIPLFLLCFWLFAAWYACTLVGEIVLIALINDAIHSRIHIKGHWLERFRWFLWLRGRHYRHHVQEDKNFFIFDKLPDKIFGTYSRD